MALGKKTGGRHKGVPNKSTTNAREAIARFIDGNAHRLQGWLDEIAKSKKHGPTVAMRCLTDLLEYHVPKLGRVELTGEDGGPLQVKLVNYSPTEQLGPKALPAKGVVRTRTGLPPRRAGVA